MDEAASKVRMRQVEPPEQVRSIREELEKLHVEKEAAISAQDYERAASLRDKTQTVQNSLDDARRKWEKKGSSASL